MIKRVNVKTNTEIRNIETPVYNSKQNITMNTKDIRTCLMKGAYVYEILDDGSTLRLDLDNYNKENNKPVAVMNFSKEEEVVISNDNNEELPVITEAPVVEEVVEPVAEEEPEAEEVVEPEIKEEAPVVEEVVEPEVKEAPVVEEVVEPEVKEEAPVVANTKSNTTNKNKNKNKKK